MCVCVIAKFSSAPMNAPSGLYLSANGAFDDTLLLHRNLRYLLASVESVA